MKFLKTCFLTTALLPLSAMAQENSLRFPQTPASLSSSATEQSSDDDERIELEFTTYGSVNATRSNFYKNKPDLNPKKRLRTDIERVVIEPELEFYPNIKLETEIEFEHGGTGSTLEFDPIEESGEFEAETEAGGEVIVEKLMLQIEDRPWLNYRMGYITVPVGMISQRHHPQEYFTTMRNRAEERILPSTWRESGVSIYGDVGAKLHYELGAFNGLNSEFFRSSSWIKGGQSRLFEDIAADDIAVAFRLDYGQYFTRNLIGFSLYQGNSQGNRRKMDALNDEATVFIWDVHAFYDSPTWTFRALYLRGSLSNADKVSAANKSLNGPADPGTNSAVGSEAEAWFAELGYNIQRLIASKRRLDVFGRFDSVDPMKSTTGNIRAEPRFKESGWTTGVNWYLRPEIVFKGQYGEHKTGFDELPADQQISIGFGWFYSTEG